MFTYIALFISLKLAFDIRKYVINKLKNIERDENGEIKIKSQHSRWYKKLFQKSIAIVMYIMQEKKKKILKKNQNKHIKKRPEYVVSEEKYTSKTQLSNLAYALKKYEEFIKQDLTLLIKKANSFLSSLRQKIIKNKDFNTNLCSQEFKEIVEICNYSSSAIEKFSNKFCEYQKTMLEQKPISAQHIAMESRLNKIITELSIRERMLDLTKNKDCSFVQNYLKKNNINVSINSRII